MPARLYRNNDLDFHMQITPVCTLTAAVHTSLPARWLNTGRGSADFTGCAGLFPDCSPIRSFRELNTCLVG